MDTQATFQVKRPQYHQQVYNQQLIKQLTARKGTSVSPHKHSETIK